ncbi:baseplate assembly protein [Acidovorax radicis]|uniref:baseplate assembly protein n=1 Tax=Acidovorax radicis TaxID=758826 RepID=UPI0002376DF6|nr:baseplate J/gp47 family protein [Acidovorax radicis]
MSTLDLSALPLPAVVETLDYETVLAGLRADLLRLYPPAAEVIGLESEPLNKLMQVAAYREVLIRARINDAARAVMLGWAVGTDLDNLAARYDLARLPDEDDESLRERVLMGYHALSAAGSSISWRLRARSVSVDVRKVDVWADRPGRVKVCLLARVAAHANDVTPDQAAVGRALFGDHPQALSQSMCWRVAVPGDAIVGQTEAALLAEDVRPLTVDVDVTAARVLPLAVVATLVHPPGPDGALLAASAAARVRALGARAAFRVDVTRAALIAALMGDGIRDVLLASPIADVPAGPGQVPVITSITVTPQARHD